MKMNTVPFSTADFCLATTLVTLQFPVIGLDTSNHKRVKFLFPDNPTIRAVIDSYWRKEIKVFPQEFYANQRTLKSRIYER